MRYVLVLVVFAMHFSFAEIGYTQSASESSQDFIKKVKKESSFPKRLTLFNQRNENLKKLRENLKKEKEISDKEKQSLFKAILWQKTYSHLEVSTITQTTCIDRLKFAIEVIGLKDKEKPHSSSEAIIEEFKALCE